MGAFMQKDVERLACKRFRAGQDSLCEVGPASERCANPDGADIRRGVRERDFAALALVPFPAAPKHNGITDCERFHRSGVES